MGKKMAQKDKIMLLILLVVVVVAISLILPTYGIFGCKDTMSELSNKTLDLDTAIEDNLKLLTDAGVSAGFATNSIGAARDLDKKIMSAKRDAANLVNSIMAYTDNFNVTEWITGPEFRGGIKSDDAEKLIDFSELTDIESSAYEKKAYYPVNGTSSYELQHADREISFKIRTNDDCDVVLDYAMDGSTVGEIGALLVYLQQLTSKGSIRVSSLSYEFGNSEEAGGHIAFEALMTATNSLSDYAREIQEADANAAQ